MMVALNNEKHGKGTHCAEMGGADSSAENTLNAPEFICPICLLKPNSSGFQWKKALLGDCSPCLSIENSPFQEGESKELK